MYLLLPIEIFLQASSRATCLLPLFPHPVGQWLFSLEALEQFSLLNPLMLLGDKGLSSLDWPGTQRFSCLFLLSAGIEALCHLGFHLGFEAKSLLVLPLALWM